MLAFACDRVTQLYIPEKRPNFDVSSDGLRVEDSQLRRKTLHQRRRSLVYILFRYMYHTKTCI
jgi:hypothetical protein